MKRQLLEEISLKQGQESVKESVFKIYKDVRDIGTQVKEDLLDDKSIVSEGKNTYSFRLNSGFEQSGIMDRSYGIFLLISLLDGYEANFTKGEKNRLKNSIIELLDYVKEHGFDASPYANGENKAIFKDKDISFIESLTWSFSSFLFAHKLQKREKGDFDFSKDKYELDKIVAKSLQILIDNVIRKVDGKYMLGYEAASEDYVGWGAISGSKQPSLYFTNSVCETYGDLEDTLLGNAELGIARDQEYINQINSIAGYDIVSRFEEICKVVGENTYKQYGAMLGNDFFYEDGSVATKGQIEYSTQSPVLFNQLYAVMIPIYTNYYKTLEKNDVDAFNLFQLRIKDGVDMVYKEYTELLSKGKEGIVNRDPVSFFGVFEDKRSASILNKERINIAVLEALIVRSRAQIVTYVTKYPEKELGEIIGIIEKNRPDEGKWIWGDLQETERSISALKEFYDYYKDYERNYAKMTADSETLNVLHKKELDDQMAYLKEEYKNESKRLKDKHDKEVAELRAQISLLTGLVDTGSPIEREIKKSIDECIAERIDVILTERLSKITELNLGNDVEISEEDLMFKKALDKYVTSYFADAIRLSKIKDGRPAGYQALPTEKILENAKECMDAFLSDALPLMCLNGSSEDMEEIASHLWSSNTGVVNIMSKQRGLRVKD